MVGLKVILRRNEFEDYRASASLAKGKDLTGPDGGDVFVSVSLVTDSISSRVGDFFASGIGHG